MRACPHTRPLGPLVLAMLIGELPAAPPYAIVDTGQIRCYDNQGEIAPPKAGDPFYGQDAQFQGHAANYTPSADGLTVHDKITDLTWQRSPDTDGNGRLDLNDKLTWTQAQDLPKKLNAEKFGGFDDWRLPSIKELYSLFDGRGTDPSGYSGADTSGLTPYIDTNFFHFAYGDMAAGERIIDSQYASGTKYVGKSARGFDKLFGVNFADGRIKGYDLQMPGGLEKAFFVQCVRGNRDYGKNDFQDNGDQTITDRATGLTWSKADSGKGMDWQAALEWVQTKNAARYLGHDDWRLPDAKELQSIVDYSRSPDTSHSAAIDPLFYCTQITNEIGQVDYPCHWTGTTHGGFIGNGAAMYIAFGRAAGWLSARALTGGAPGRHGPPAKGPPTTKSDAYRFADVHGAGAQRSDPKSGDPAMFPHGRGPQGDVIRIFNYVRLVRGGDVTRRTDTAQIAPAPQAQAMSPAAQGPPGGPAMLGPHPPIPPIVTALDSNGDGTISAGEIAGATSALKKLDRNGDRKLTPDEYLPPRPGR
ncbi:MAG TPA: DUF1566 domain-containing protein [Verrucomicrobiae bacterium]|nr:DUF1566 domain-containing protein [Verrucomicrobiae bacterium]